MHWFENRLGASHDFMDAGTDTLQDKRALVGIGLYTVPEAARLSRVPYRTIRRWMLGYADQRGESARDVPPLWRSQVPKVDDTVGLSFLDLIEIRFVHAFRRHGVSLTVIRRTAERAYEIFGRDHPFTRTRFRTDGRSIFAEVLEETGQSGLLNVPASQYAFRQFIEPSLYASLEISDEDDVLRWYPDYPKRRVVVDPDRSFGRPIVVQGGVPTEILAQAARAEDSEQRAAKLFDVSVTAVRAAIAFEASLAV